MVSMGRDEHRFGMLLPAAFADDEPAIRVAWAAECRAQGGEPIADPTWELLTPVLDEIDGVPQYPALMVVGRARAVAD
jgi:hypothetical protein